MPSAEKILRSMSMSINGHLKPGADRPPVLLFFEQLMSPRKDETGTDGERKMKSLRTVASQIRDEKREGYYRVWWQIVVNGESIYPSQSWTKQEGIEIPILEQLNRIAADKSVLDFGMDFVPKQQIIKWVAT